MNVIWPYKVSTYKNTGKSQCDSAYWDWGSSLSPFENTSLQNTVPIVGTKKLVFALWVSFLTTATNIHWLFLLGRYLIATNTGGYLKLPWLYIWGIYILGLDKKCLTVTSVKYPYCDQSVSFAKKDIKKVHTKAKTSVLCASSPAIIHSVSLCWRVPFARSTILVIIKSH